METDSIRLSSSFNGWEFSMFQNPGDLVSLVIIVLLLLVFLMLTRSAGKAYSSDFISTYLTNKNKDAVNERVFKNLQNAESLQTAISAVSFITNIVLVFLLDGLTNLVFTGIHFVILKAFLQIVLIILILFISGELIPEFIAAKVPLTITRLTAYPVFWFEWLLRPFSRLFLRFTKSVNDGNSDNRTPISIEEITQVLHMNNETESADEKEILEEIVKFGNKNVSDIMKPRIDVVSLDIKTSFSEVLNVIIDSGFSRIPVFSGSFDNIRGILYVKDILPHSHKGDSFNWQSVIRPSFFVPETKKINALLQEFQKNKVHLAMVIDEYGGTSGIVTLEDILEEIVGEIVDEFDEEDHYFTKIDENIYLFDGKTLIGDFLKTTKCDDTVFDEIGGEYETLAGLILELKGDIPQLNDKIQYKHFTFTIEAADKRRILKIKVEIVKE